MRKPEGPAAALPQSMKMGWNFMAFFGPDFKSGFVDTAPASNADVGRTVAAVMRLDFKGKGVLTGRILSEAMPGGVMPDIKGWSVASEPAENGLRTVIDLQAVGTSPVFQRRRVPWPHAGQTASPDKSGMDYLCGRW